MTPGELAKEAQHVIERACPYGQPMDRLWVRESFQPLYAEGVTHWGDTDYKTGKGYAISYPATDGIKEFYDESNDNPFCDRVTPSIHMPRWASRLTLEITGVRVERLQDISEDDAKAEGAREFPGIPIGTPHRYGTPNRWSCFEAPPNTDHCLATPKWAFANLWNKINGERSWDANPWVWVVEFSPSQPLGGA